MKLEAMVFAAICVLGSAGVRADEALECNGVSSAADLSNVSLGVITGGKVNVLANASDKADCPSTAPACRKRAFLLDGNKVVFDTDIAKGGFVCVAYIDAKGHETDGWLPAASVKPLPLAPSWAGRWKRDTSSQIDIKGSSNAKAALSGEATWGEGGGTHIGDISADIDSSQAVQSFATDGDKQVPYDKAGQYDCAVKLKQLGPYLFVDDNSNCGGANVTFSGIYTKR